MLIQASRDMDLRPTGITLLPAGDSRDPDLC